MTDERMLKELEELETLNMFDHYKEAVQLAIKKLKEQSFKYQARYMSGYNGGYINGYNDAKEKFITSIKKLF